MEYFYEPNRTHCGLRFSRCLSRAGVYFCGRGSASTANFSSCLSVLDPKRIVWHLFDEKVLWQDSAGGTAPALRGLYDGTFVDPFVGVFFGLLQSRLLGCVDGFPSLSIRLATMATMPAFRLHVDESPINARNPAKRNLIAGRLPLERPLFCGPTH